MIELQRHIEILLLTNDCVIVPGLGGFMAHHIDARFDEEDNTFVPPLRTLGFNQNLTMNDSLLVQSYIERYDVSYPEALRRIEDEVSELRQHLQTDGYYELNDIGMLTLNDEGNIEFRPCEAGILTPSLYGLGTFEMQPLRKLEEKAAERHDTTSATLVADTKKVEPDKQQQSDDRKSVDEELERTIVIKMSWLRNAVAVAAAVLAFFMISSPVSNSKLETQTGVQQSSFIPLSPQSTSMLPEEKLVYEADDETIVTTEESEDVAANETETAKTGTEAVNVQPAEEYCIVLASQVGQKNAERFVEQLADQGFKEAYITNVKSRRVLYGHYATKDDALDHLRQLRQQSRKLFGEGWVMKNS